MLIARCALREVFVHVDVQMPRPGLITEGNLNVSIDGLGRITLRLTINCDLNAAIYIQDRSGWGPPDAPVEMGTASKREAPRLREG
ncbi:MAG: hypothetical protein QF415_02485 [Candidatus Undinarchaeales archaeon]|jgi:hypothetical protein|nr:hypothetical protein [Candidatus Undinarchaeales archaeon]MDP7492272.1 hypothetical protein [Candidatus Undinarchaeales archaeon]